MNYLQIQYGHLPNWAEISQMVNVLRFSSKEFRKRIIFHPHEQAHRLPVYDPELDDWVWCYVSRALWITHEEVQQVEAYCLVGGNWKLDFTHAFDPLAADYMDYTRQFRVVQQQAAVEAEKQYLEWVALRGRDPLGRALECILARQNPFDFELDANWLRQNVRRLIGN